MPWCKRTLIGRVDPKTSKIKPTDGRCRKNSPYNKTEKTQEELILERLKPLKISQLRKDTVRLESELQKAKEKLQNWKTNRKEGNKIGTVCKYWNKILDDVDAERKNESLVRCAEETADAQGNSDSIA